MVQPSRFPREQDDKCDMEAMNQQASLPSVMDENGAGYGAYGADSRLLKSILGDNVIRQGDAIELMRSLPDNGVDLLLTDIPYARVNKPSNGLRIIDKKEANTETFDLDSFAREALRITKGSAVIFLRQGAVQPAVPILR